MPERDQTELRFALMRKLTAVLDQWWRCPARTCRRQRACVSPALECAHMPARKTMSRGRERAKLANLSRALARKLAQTKIDETNRVEK